MSQQTQQIPNYLDNVPEYYKGKSILITGATGFLAKIIVSKLYDSCPDFKKIYLLIRGKKSASIQDRMKKDVLDSECIQMVFQKRPHLKQALKSKTIPVEGDLIKDGLGLKPADRQMLIKNVDIVISSAASVYFHDPIQEALNINFYGTIRLMHLALECKKSPAFIQISTAFTNANQPPSSTIKEQIYEDSIPGDPEKVAAEIMSWTPSQAAERQKGLLGTFPNTYTFTKHLAEKVVFKLRGNLPCAITRPSIVISSVRDPCPGWIDTIAAAGVVVLTLANGQKHVTRFGHNVIYDVIPADYAVNAIILAAPYAASNPAIPRIFNSSTTVSKMITVRDFYIKLMKDVSFNRFEQQQSSPWCYPINNRDIYDFVNWFELKAQLVPAQIMTRVPFLATDQLKKLLAFGTKQVNFLNKCYDQLDRFMQNGWYADATELQNCYDSLNKQTKEMFPCDARDIDWDQTIRDFLLGLQKFWSNQDDPVLHHNYKQIVRQNQLPWFYSPRLMMTKRQNITEKSTNTLFSKILNNQKFQHYVALNSESIPEITKNYKKIQLDLQKAKKQINMLSSKVQTSAVVPLFSMMNTVARRAFDGLFVDQGSLDTVKGLLDKGEKVILMPTYKSFADSFILTMIFLLQDMDVPFTFGSYEDTPRYQLYDTFLSKMGYILNQRKKGQALQDHYLNSQLLFEVMNQYSMAVVYQNDTRLRSGKFSSPVKGDLSINWVLHAFSQLSNKKKLHIVPVCINYDRLLEMKILAVEMVSGVNPNLSLSELMQKLYAFNNHQLGRCTVKFLEPINLARYTEHVNMSPVTPRNLQQVSLQLTTDLYREQANNSYVTMNMIVASFLLEEKKNSITVKELTKKCKTLFAYLKENKVATLMTRVPDDFTVTKNVIGLGFSIKTEGKKQVVSLDAKNEQRTILSLAYYSIGLFSHRVAESCLAIVIKNHFKNSDEPLSIMECSSQMSALEETFRVEYIYRDDLSIQQTFIYRIKQLHKFGEIEYDDLNQTISIKKGGSLFNFFYELGFYMLETYYVVLMTIEAVRSENQKLKIDKLVETIHEALKDLHNMQVLKNLHACLDETVRTSLMQFDRLKLCKIDNFSIEDGSEESFINVPEKYKDRIYAQLDLLAQHLSLSNEGVNMVEEAVAKAIEQASVVYLAKM